MGPLIEVLKEQGEVLKEKLDQAHDDIIAAITTPKQDVEVAASKCTSGQW